MGLVHPALRQAEGERIRNDQYGVPNRFANLFTPLEGSESQPSPGKHRWDDSLSINAFTP